MKVVTRKIKVQVLEVGDPVIYYTSIQVDSWWSKGVLEEIIKDKKNKRFMVRTEDGRLIDARSGIKHGHTLPCPNK